MTGLRKESQFIIDANRITLCLRRAGITSRRQLLTQYDAHSHFTDIKGIGPKLGKQLRQMLDEYGPIEWQAAMPLIEWG